MRPRGAHGLERRRARPGRLRGRRRTMADLATVGLIDVHGDAAMAAAHFTALTSHSTVRLSHYGVLPLPKQDTDHLITGGVTAFLRACHAGR